MSQRITKNTVYTALNVLNQTLENKGHTARYTLDVWHPDDREGTRYQLIDYRQHIEYSRVLSAAECYNVLYTLIRVIERL